jgi:DNA helicase-2/ATP-dependent DNA helicase PcrA
MPTGNTFETAYKRLNKEQKKAVDTIEGPVMVVAGPGTGKTTILTFRIANILKSTDTNPENILALTFTNSGVHAMRQKLLEYIGDEAYRVNIFTFHSFAEHIIREFSFHFKQFEFSRVIGDLDKVKIIEDIIRGGDFKEIVHQYDQFASLRQVMSAIDDLKKEGIDPDKLGTLIPEWEKDMFESDDILYKRKTGDHQVGDVKPSEKEKIDNKVKKAKEIQTVFAEYQKALIEKGFYDFSDMILTVLAELEKNSNLKLDLQEQYQYLLVDEHQDTNDGQNRLIELLSDAKHLDGRPNLFTVGDEKQSIYRFQGASEETFKYFNEHFTDVAVVNLEDNYRSTKNILDGAYSLIEYTIPDSVKLTSSQKDNSPIQFAEFSNYKFELLRLAQDIKEKIDTGVPVEEIAVIYRANKHVSDIKNVFNRMGIPHTILSKNNLLEDSHVQNLIAMLRVVENPLDNHSLAKALFARFLELDSFDVVSLIRQFNLSNRRSNKNLVEYIADAEQLEKAGIKNQDKFVELASVLKDLKTESENTDVVSFLKIFLEKIGYLKFMLASNDSRDQLLNIDKIFDEIKRQNQNKKEYALKDFLSFVDAYEKYGLNIETNDPEVVQGVKLMTAHKSKGLEFEYVYIIGATRSNWEKSRGFNKIALPIDDYKGDAHDERRLFYVSMTRAKKGLSISSSLTDWEGREQDKSQFVSEIEPACVEVVETNSFEKENLDNLNIFITPTSVTKTVWDEEYLKQVFLKSGLNVTALNNYLECPIKYLFRSLIKLPSEYSANLVFGNVVHDALEEFFKESHKAEKILEKDLLISAFEKAIDHSTLVGSDYERYLKHGRKILRDYYDEYASEWPYDVLTEKYMRHVFALDSGEEIVLSGILDKIEYMDPSHEGEINVVDYKTGKPYSEKSKKSQKEDLERQIVFYHILLEEYGDRLIVKKAVLDFLEKNKKVILNNIVLRWVKRRKTSSKRSSITFQTK